MYLQIHTRYLGTCGVYTIFRRFFKACSGEWLTLLPANKKILHRYVKNTWHHKSQAFHGRINESAASTGRNQISTLIFIHITNI